MGEGSSHPASAHFENAEFVGGLGLPRSMASSFEGSERFVEGLPSLLEVTGLDLGFCEEKVEVATEERRGFLGQSLKSVPKPLRRSFRRLALRQSQTNVSLEKSIIAIDCRIESFEQLCAIGSTETMVGEQGI